MAIKIKKGKDMNIKYSKAEDILLLEISDGRIIFIAERG